MQSVLSPYHTKLDAESNYDFKSEVGKKELSFGDGDSITNGGQTSVANRIGIALLVDQQKSRHESVVGDDFSLTNETTKANFVSFQYSHEEAPFLNLSDYQYTEE